MRVGAAILLLASALGCLGQPPTADQCAIFPADNIWNTPVDTLPVSPNSAAYVNTIGASAHAHADFGSGLWQGAPIGIPWIPVPGTQPKYPVVFQYADESDPGPYAIPLSAPIEGGSGSTGDRHAIAVDTDHCILYELYSAYPQASSWEAGSGVIFDLKSNALRPAGWTSADAAGLPIQPGLARYDEVAAGEIRHALRFTAPQTQRSYAWPARHYASSLTDPKYPPMGQRFRLKATFDISPFPADVQVILRALKKYGMMLADNGSAWYISGAPDDRWNNDHLATMRNIPGSAFEAVDVSSLMIDPNSGQARQSGVSVTVLPASAVVPAGASQQFTAAVQNAAPAVTWSVNGTIGGAAETGLIDANGRYVAPLEAPPSGMVLVRASSVAAPTASGTATVTIQNAAPLIAGVTPKRVREGTVAITVTGRSFLNGAVIHLGSTALETSFVSSSQLSGTGGAGLSGTDVPVVVVNPDGTSSNAYCVTVLPSGSGRRYRSRGPDPDRATAGPCLLH